MNKEIAINFLYNIQANLMTTVSEYDQELSNAIDIAVECIQHCIDCEYLERK